MSMTQGAEKYTLDPRTLLGSTPKADALRTYLEQLSAHTSCTQFPSPDIKVYQDVIYYNYYPLGLSLMFVAQDGSKSLKNVDPQSDLLVLDSIDIYNPEGPSKSASSKPSSDSQEYQLYPTFPLILSLLPSKEASSPRADTFSLTAASTGKEVISALGEPDRKGGGAGPSSGSINIWTEWTRDGIMVEFGGSDARGPQAWERGKEAKWKVLTLFRSKG